MNKPFDVLLKIDELLPETLALADLIQTSANNDGLISTESVEYGADMLYCRLTQISQIVKESIKEAQQGGCAEGAEKFHTAEMEGKA